jgi:CDP-diacylglycerol--glycerol-3-phosphate 3-phosphatidyltransferase
MNFANKISTFRILTVPLFIATLIYYVPGKEHLRYLALGIFILAVISDALDGYIARKSKMQSEAGMILDPLGDKLLLMSAFVCLSFDKFPLHFPLGVVLTVISRDVLILLGTIVIFIVKQDLDISPTRWGKLTTTFQMSAAIAVLLQWTQGAPVLWWSAVFFTVISGVDYVMRGFKKLYAVDIRRNTH